MPPELAQPRLLVYAVAADEGGIAEATVSSNWRPARRVPANFSGRSGAHSPLADDRVRCFQLTIRAGADARAFAQEEEPGVQPPDDRSVTKPIAPAPRAG